MLQFVHLGNRSEKLKRKDAEERSSDKKWMPFFLIFLAAYTLYGSGAVGAAEDNPIFLLGDNEKLTIVSTEGKARTLELGVNPVTVLRYQEPG
jgi:hypothetical protein